MHPVSALRTRTLSATTALVATFALLLVGLGVPTAHGQVDPAALDRACPEPLPAVNFADVSSGDVHARAITCLVAYGVTEGISATSYGPNQSVTRGQMATFLARLMRVAGEPLDPPATAQFTDAAGVHRDNIEALAAAGVVQGTGANTFSPAQNVTRAQMATFIGRAMEALSVDLPDVAPDFDDVSTGVHAPAIGRLAAAGVVQGRTATTYDPSGLVTRAQMGSFLMRANDILAGEGITTPTYLDDQPDDTPLDPIDVDEGCTAPPKLVDETDSIDTAGESRSYALSLTADQRLSFVRESGSTSLRWSLVGPGGEVFDGNFGAPNHVIDVSPAGEYTLQVYSTGSTGSYALTVNDVTDPSCNLVVELEGDGPPMFEASRNAPIEGIGRIEVVAEYHRYFIAAPAGQRLSFGRLSGSTSLGWRLIGPGGEVFDGNFGAPNQIIDIATTGHYRLEVYGRGLTTSEYSFRLADVTEPSLTVPVGSLPFTASRNAPVPGAGIIEVVAEYQRYPFTATAGQRLSFERQSGSTSLGWRLIGPGGEVFDGNFGAPQQIVDITTTGDYRLEVYGRGLTTGEYSFTISSVS